MKPDVERLIDVAAAHLMMRIGPMLGPGYEQSSLLLMMALLTAMREEFERAASRRAEENREMRRIFADALDVAADASLRARLEASAAGEDASLLISALEAANVQLRELLIDLHEHVEQLESPSAHAIEARIWRELAASTERRRLTMGPF